MLEENLRKPFRLCSKASLFYSKDNGALTAIKLSSLPKRMTEAQARAELEGMVAVLKQKYEGKQNFFELSKLFYGSNSGLSFNEQHFRVLAEKVMVDPRGVLKGTPAKKDEAYVFIVEFRDDAVMKAPKKDDPAPKVDAQTGSDVL